MMNADGSGAHRVSYDTAVVGGRPAWSPDGQRIAYSSFQTGQGQIWSTSAFNNPAPVRVTSRTIDDMFPAWSPDGGSILFTEGRWGSGALLSVNLSSGAVTTVAN